MLRKAYVNNHYALLFVHTTYHIQAVIRIWGKQK